MHDLVQGEWTGQDRSIIDGANHTLFVQNERYQDSVIIESCQSARRCGPCHGEKHSLKKINWLKPWADSNLDDGNKIHHSGI
jgi:hypothetical protein